MRFCWLAGGVVLLLAGCASDPVHTSEPRGARRDVSQPPRAPIQQRYQAAPEEPVVMTAPQGDFSIWLRQLKQEATAKGVQPQVVDAAFEGFDGPIERVIRLDRKQPEKTITWPEYRQKVVSDVRVRKGRELLAQHDGLLSRVSSQFGVPKEVIVALWGIETSFGEITGNYEIPHALATLAYEGRRAEFFRKELLDALHILNEGHVRHESMLGSWAGAMGQCQFMPSSFRRYAVDFDGDGHKNIWTSQPDVFASIANYLSSSGWNAGESWGQAVTLPDGFNQALEGRDTKKTAAEWASLGVRTVDGKKPSGAGRYSIVIPRGSEGAYLTTANYDVIMKWNRSTFFATAVGTLADRLK